MLYARCPLCNAKVRVTSRRWDVKQQAYVLQQAYGLHAPHNRSYDPGRCDMSGKKLQTEVLV